MRFVTTFLFLSILNLSESSNLQCNFGTGDYTILRSVKQCTVSNNPEIITPSTCAIESVNEGFGPDVKALYIHTKTILFFPRRLEKFFTNLEMILVYRSKLKNINQADLKPFVELRELYLHENLIEILKSGLFEFNKKLEYVHIGSNKIAHIDSNVFDSLGMLRYLFLDYNVCTEEKADNSLGLVRLMIEKITEQCQDVDKIESKLRTFEDPQFHVTTDTLAIFKERFNEVKAMLGTLNLTKMDKISLSKRLDEIYELKFAEVFKSSEDIQATKVEMLSKRMKSLEEVTQKMMKMISNLAVLENAEAYSKCEGEWKG